MKKALTTLITCIVVISAQSQINITSYDLKLQSTDYNFSMVIANDTIYTSGYKVLKKWSFKTGDLFKEIPCEELDGRDGDLEIDHDGFIATDDNGVLKRIRWNGKLDPYKFDVSKHSTTTGDLFGAKGRMGMYINGWVFYKAKKDSFYTPDKIGPFTNGSLKSMYSTDRYNLFVSGNEVYIEHFSPSSIKPTYTEHKDYEGRFKLLGYSVLDSYNRLWFLSTEGFFFDESDKTTEFEVEPIDYIGDILLNDAQGNVLFNGNFSGYFVDAATLDVKKIFKKPSHEIGIGFPYKGYNYLFSPSHLLLFEKGDYKTLLFDSTIPSFDFGHIVDNENSLYLYTRKLVWVFDKQNGTNELITSNFGIVDGFVNKSDLIDTTPVWFVNYDLSNQKIIGSVSRTKDTLKNYYHEGINMQGVSILGFDKNGNPLVGEYEKWSDYGLRKVLHRNLGFKPRPTIIKGSIKQVKAIDENDFAIISGTGSLTLISWFKNGDEYTLEMSGDSKKAEIYYGADGSLFFYDQSTLSVFEINQNNEMALNRLVVNFENIETIIPISAENRSFYFLQQNNELIYRWRFGEINVSDSLDQKFKSIRATSFDQNGNLWLIDTFGLHKIEFNRLFTSRQLSEEVKLNVYPNPANDYIELQSFNGAEYEIRTMEGKVVMKGKNDNRILTSALAKGVYCLKVEEKVCLFIKK